MGGGLLLNKVADSYTPTMFVKPQLNYSPTGRSLGSYQVSLALSNTNGCILRALVVLEFVYEYRAKGPQHYWQDGKSIHVA